MSTMDEMNGFLKAQETASHGFEVFLERERADGKPKEFMDMLEKSEVFRQLFVMGFMAGMSFAAEDMFETVEKNFQ